MSDVTVVLTSCGRADLLERTLDSFFEQNSYPIARFIVTEDSDDPACERLVCGKYGSRVEPMFNRPRLGQIASIDKAYATVQTEWIFHCEDDWRFYRGGFIEDSMAVLREDPQLLQVWLRDLWDTNGHPPEREVRRAADGTLYRLMTTGYRLAELDWHGFSFNPGLRRTADYRLLGRYGSVGHESEVGDFYFRRGFRAAILERSAVEHIGGGRHLTDVREEVLRRGWRGALRRYVRPLVPPIVVDLGKRVLR
jgi:hypothetical protein